MLLAATTHGPLDKSSWPRIQALPADLPAPATGSAATEDEPASFAAGTFGPHSTAYASRLSPATDWDSDPAREAVTMLGRDPRAALAAASAIAGQQQLRYDHHAAGGDVHEQTVIGLYRDDSGTCFAAPLWDTAHTFDMLEQSRVDLTFAASPDARFRFNDPRLMAVVATDGFIVNPTFEASFEA